MLVEKIVHGMEEEDCDALQQNLDEEHIHKGPNSLVTRRSLFWISFKSRTKLAL
ncbi:hypothetical protein A2U01_0091347, partial [Trifolium medium]|nr:hypothetical protein [Trifolium medium]